MMTTLERLKQQANLYTDVSGRWSNAAGVEKMIDLVVLECIGVADHSNVNGKSIIGQRIKEHFGIE